FGERCFFDSRSRFRALAHLLVGVREVDLRAQILRGIIDETERGDAQFFRRAEIVSALRVRDAAREQRHIERITRLRNAGERDQSYSDDASANDFHDDQITPTPVSKIRHLSLLAVRAPIPALALRSPPPDSFA